MNLVIGTTKWILDFKVGKDVFLLMKFLKLKMLAIYINSRCIGWGHGLLRQLIIFTSIPRNFSGVVVIFIVELLLSMVSKSNLVGAIGPGMELVLPKRDYRLLTGYTLAEPKNSDFPAPKGFFGLGETSSDI